MNNAVAIAIISSVFASSGFWAFITYLYQKRETKKDAITQMIIGLGHDRICHLGSDYINQGYITRDDYENLNDYLYIPYKALGGNGTAEKIMKEVDKLPIRKEKRYDKLES